MCCTSSRKLSERDIVIYSLPLKNVLLLESYTYCVVTKDCALQKFGKLVPSECLNNEGAVYDIWPKYETYIMPAIIMHI